MSCIVVVVVVGRTGTVDDDLLEFAESGLEGLEIGFGVDAAFVDCFG